MSIVQYLDGSPWFSSVIGGHMIVIPPLESILENFGSIL